MLDERVQPLSDIIGQNCSICIEAFEIGDTLSLSPNVYCEHFFHQKCIINWLARSSNCPACRRDYLIRATENNTIKESEYNVQYIEQDDRPPSHDIASNADQTTNEVRLPNTIYDEVADVDVHFPATI
jgi:hypothetical protein